MVFKEPNGTRRVRNFSDLEEAKREGELVATRLCNGESDVLELRNSDVAELLSARTALAPFNLSVVAAVNEFTAAKSSLPAGASILEAVGDFARRHPANMPRKTVAEVVAEFIADRKGAGCSEIHLRDLGIRLGQFATAFVMPITALTAPMVQQFIYGPTRENDRKPASNRTKENMLRVVVSLFNFARRMKYVSAELAFEIAEIPTPKKQPVPIGIYTADEMRSILAAAESDIVPALAICAFAGLRLAEVSRLDWREIRLPERLIIIEADKAKTAARRLVPISDNLAAWLAPDAKPFGPVNPCIEEIGGNVGHALGCRFQRTLARAKIEAKRNALRHSYITYRVAVAKDVAATALECGNSPAVIFSSYRALATEAQAKAWFAITPDAPANVLPIPETATA